MADDKRSLVVKIEGNSKDLQDELAKVRKQTENLDKNLESVAKKSGAAFLATTGVIALTVKAFADYEDALLGVGKTTNLQGKELENFGQQFQKLSRTIPVSTIELLNVGQAAAQLGVEGSDNILNFSETIAKLARTTDLSSEEAAQSLARLINITDNSIEEVGNLGAAIVGLGNTFATTESQIVRSGTEVAKAAGTFGVSAEDALALGAALSATGQQAEVSGSVIGRTFRAISSSINKGGESIENLSRLTGIATTDLKQQFGEDAVGVFEKFAIGLGKVEGSKIADTLAGFKLSGDEVLKVLPPLVKNTDNLTAAIALSRREFESATALNNEFEIQTKSLNSETIKLQNTFSGISVQIGGTFKDRVKSAIVALNDFASKFFNLDIETKKNIGTILAWTAGITGAIAGIATLGLGVTALKVGLAGLSVLIGPLGIAFSVAAGTAALLYSQVDDIKLGAQRVGATFKALGAFLVGGFVNNVDGLRIKFNELRIAAKNTGLALIEALPGEKFKAKADSIRAEILKIKDANKELDEDRKTRSKSFLELLQAEEDELRLKRFNEQTARSEARQKEEAERNKKIEEDKKRAQEQLKLEAEERQKAFEEKKEKLLAENQELRDLEQEQKEEFKEEDAELEAEKEEVEEEKKEAEREAILLENALRADFNAQAKQDEITRLKKSITDLKKLRDKARNDEEKAQFDFLIKKQKAQLDDAKKELDLFKTYQTEKEEFDKNTKSAAFSLAQRFAAKILGNERASALKSFSIQKLLALKKIAIKTKDAAIDAFARGGGYPTGIPFAAASLAYGAIQAASVTSQSLGLNQGGLVTGGSAQNIDSVPTVLTRGELVAPRNNFDEVVEGVIKQRGFINPNEQDGEVFTNNQTKVIIELKDDAASVLTAQQFENSSLGTDRNL